MDVREWVWRRHLGRLGIKVDLMRTGGPRLSMRGPIHVTADRWTLTLRISYLRKEPR